MSTTLLPPAETDEPALLPAVQTGSFLTAAALAASLDDWSAQRAVITRYIQEQFTVGVDYYTIQIQGRETKPTLGKPGAEKFLGLFRLQASFRKDDETWEMLGRPNGVLCYVCTLLTRSGEMVGEGRGARDIKKDGGDINKAVKMAEKSALIDAILRTGALSDAFTQDIGDPDDKASGAPATLSPALMRDKVNEVLADLGKNPQARREWWDALSARLEGEPTMHDMRQALLTLEKRLRSRQDAPESTITIQGDSVIDPSVPTQPVAVQAPFWRDILIAHGTNPKLPKSLRDQIALVTDKTPDSRGLELAGAVMDWVDQADKGVA